MSSFRFDEMTERWVVIASARRGLPVDPSLRVASPASTAHCPFCPGHESETEETVAAFRNARGEWTVRVVRNRYPTVTLDDAPSRAGAAERPAHGVHEVIVESRAHDLDLADFEPDDATQAMRMYRDRFRALAARDDIEAIALFRNHGVRAGSSQSHPHAQLIATSLVHTDLARRTTIAREHVRATGRSILERAIERAREDGTRWIDEHDGFVAFCPFAPHRSFETWIAPVTDQMSFGDVEDSQLAPLARIVTRMLRRIRACLGDVAYNLVVRSPPVRERTPHTSFWYLELLPRTGGDAGFELSTGTDVVPTSPEDAAAQLRAARP